MSLPKYLIKLTLVLSCVSTLAFAAPHDDVVFREGPQETFHQEELQTRDSQMLRDWLMRKQREEEEEATQVNLDISGDIRFCWQNQHETLDGEDIRGGDAIDPCNCLPISNNDFDVELNLWFNYVKEKAWAVANLQFDASCGISDNDCCCDKCHRDGPDSESGDNGEFSYSSSECSSSCESCEECRSRCSYDRFHGSGEGGDVDLKRAYIGYNIFECGETRFDIELGRRKMYDIFESEIEFLSRFDGILFNYSSKMENFAEWYIKLAGFLVDQRTNHFGFVTELAFFNIKESNIDFKYSFIDWTKRGRSRCAGAREVVNPLKAIHDAKDSCGSCSSESSICSGNKTAAELEQESFIRRQRKGSRNPRGFKYSNSQVIITYHLDPEWLKRPAEVYGAALWNHACKQANRHHKSKGLGAYAGITVGKIKKEGDWSFDLQYQYVQENAVAFDDEAGIGLGDVLSDCCGPVGRGYQGVRFEGLYALTDNLTLNTLFQYADSTTCRDHDYWDFELEAIYAF